MTGLNADPRFAELRPQPVATITFDGEPIPALPGQTVAAALLAAERRVLRRTRVRDRPRGIFCGIGACFDCLVVVNGVPSQRACLVVARDGDRVERQRGTGWRAD